MTEKAASVSTFVLWSEGGQQSVVPTLSPLSLICIDYHSYIYWGWYFIFEESVFLSYCCLVHFLEWVTQSWGIRSQTWFLKHLSASIRISEPSVTKCPLEKIVSQKYCLRGNMVVEYYHWYGSYLVQTAPSLLALIDPQRSPFLVGHFCLIVFFSLKLAENVLTKLFDLQWLLFRIKIGLTDW